MISKRNILNNIVLIIIKQYVLILYIILIERNEENFRFYFSSKFRTNIEEIHIKCINK